MVLLGMTYAKGPDGTRGFAAGRGKPLAAASVACLQSDGTRAKLVATFDEEDLPAGLPPPRRRLGNQCSVDVQEAVLDRFAQAQLEPAVMSQPWHPTDTSASAGALPRYIPSTIPTVQGSTFLPLIGVPPAVIMEPNQYVGGWQASNQPCSSQVAASPPVFPGMVPPGLCPGCAYGMSLPSAPQVLGGQPAYHMQADIATHEENGPPSPSSALKRMLGISQ
mmetsp:Transcript_5703/g.12418  ORF Transcript_5703/g.12418 Transcript_5703/m.12418 type:complete len:221 (-) Transcript_5703:475-1137(-)|eukprot:3088734-Pleurochrysis_carterae.AAC.1